MREGEAAETEMVQLEVDGGAGGGGGLLRLIPGYYTADRAALNRLAIQVGPAKKPLERFAGHTRLIFSKFELNFEAGL